MADTQPPAWKPDGQRFSARPICRTHAETHKLDGASLLAFPQQHGCSIAKCENVASYLAIV